jgi:3,4-dihydroxy 2-butanone 4-phosphate synthase/GTP cyclohydrolase II
MIDPATLVAADLLATRPLNTRWGVWREHAFRYGKTDIVTLSFGDCTADDEIAVRLHSTCFSAHYLESTECDCREQLALAFEIIVGLGKGILVFLEQDGRDNGQVAIMRAAVHAKQTGSTQSDAYAALGYPADARDFKGAAAALGLLGAHKVLLLTNNPRKIAALRATGIEVRNRSITSFPTNDSARRFYRDKALEGYLIPPDHLE